MRRRFPIGAEHDSSGLTDFRVWAPRASAVELVLGGSAEVGQGADAGAGAGIRAMQRETAGYWQASCECEAGTRYRFRLEGGGLYPDPASRFQPLGPDGPSEVVDPSAYPWRDAAWTGLEIGGQVLYEIHLGTFTAEGTYRAAAADLPRLRSLGVTCIELMPVADFAGGFGWGYDGVALFAPSRLYGTPDDLRRLIDDAHVLGLGVILDVVYNHFGLEANYAPEYSEQYETDRYENEWGRSINFDGPGSAPVREFVVTNALYWLREFHFDGFRLDATQNINDSSDEHILSLLSRRCREASPRPILLVAENEPQDVDALAPPPEGWGMDAMWNDDFHHSARVALSGHAEAYYSGYRGSPQEFVSAAKWSYLYQGEYYRWQGKRRGTSTRALPRRRFVHYLDNHDQVANSAWGHRAHQLGSPGRFRALTALLLLLPQTPLLFQGQEFGSQRPFLYFADHPQPMAGDVRKGRLAFLSQFPTLAAEEVASLLPDPADPATFERCKLEAGAARSQGDVWRLHCDLLALRAADPTLTAPDCDIDGAVVGLDAFVLRFFYPSEEDRLLLVNLGTDLRADPIAEPLLAPPRGTHWALQWSSEAPEYGGGGAALPGEEEQWFLPGEAAMLLRPLTGPGPAGR